LPRSRDDHFVPMCDCVPTKSIFLIYVDSSIQQINASHSAPTEIVAEKDKPRAQER
jgi:hypothetical protein